MNTSFSSQVTLIHFAFCAAATTTCRGMITSTSMWIVSWYLLPVTIPLTISTDVEAGTVTSSLYFVDASWVFLSSRRCSHIVIMVCCLFSVADRQSNTLCWLWLRMHPLMMSASLQHCSWCSGRVIYITRGTGQI